VLARLIGGYSMLGVAAGQMIAFQVFALMSRLAQANVRWRLMDREQHSIYDF
jgi:hypothetical protein